MTALLKYAVVLTFVFAVVSLSFMVIKTFFFGRKAQYAKPRGSAGKGILFALGKGMMPSEKESASKHLPTYFAGILYHAGIFAALFYLLSLVLSLGLPGLSFVSLELPASLALFLCIVCAVGLLSGVSLVLKRVSLPALRKLSCPDDFAANLIVDAFLLLAAMSSYQRFSVSSGALSGSFYSAIAAFNGGSAGAAAGNHLGGANTLFFVVAVVMFLYVPLGKIRHCFFFFYARILLGLFYGKRGVWPAPGMRL